MQIEAVVIDGAMKGMRYEILCGTDEGGGTYVDGPLVRGHADTEAGALALALEYQGRAPQVRDTLTGQVAWPGRTGADPDDPCAAAWELAWITAEEMDRRS